MAYVKMLTSKLGSNDGLTTKHYEKGEVYEVSETLAASFIAEKAAEAAEAPAGEKSDKKAPANKAEKAAPANKAA